MDKYRKIPIIVEAQQFLQNSRDGWPPGVYKDSSYPTGYVIETEEGTFQVSEGDWIIRGIEGELYPCKPSIFAKTYEPEVNGEMPNG